MKYFTAEFTDKNYINFLFFKDNQPVFNAPVCGMTVRAAKSMRFRWNEANQNRDEVLSEIAEGRKIISVELIHSKIVYDVQNGSECDGKTGDGIITADSKFMPVVTVADCMPVYLFDNVKGIFGIVHSGWKGTGIAAEAIKLAADKYGSRPEDFSVVLGPHIKDCCYIVNEERAQYFAENFTEDCIVPLEEGGTCYAGGRGLPVTWNSGSGKLFRLSLEKANTALLKKAGVPEGNIAICSNCTCCTQLLGSNRRETAEFLAANPCADEEAVKRAFTVQAAFVKA